MPMRKILSKRKTRRGKFKRKNQKRQTAVCTNYKQLWSPFSLKNSLGLFGGFFSAIAPFVQHLSAVQAENMTSHPFEEWKGSKRAERKSLRKRNKVQGADMQHTTRITAGKQDGIGRARRKCIITHISLGVDWCSFMIMSCFQTCSGLRLLFFLSLSSLRSSICSPGESSLLGTCWCYATAGQNSSVSGFEKTELDSVPKRILTKQNRCRSFHPFCHPPGLRLLAAFLALLRIITEFERRSLLHQTPPLAPAHSPPQHTINMPYYGAELSVAFFKHPSNLPHFPCNNGRTFFHTHTH